METEKHILCGGAKGSGLATATPTLALNLWDTHGGKNITLRIEDLNEKLWRDIPPAFQDLLEMAAYVYCCDQTEIRGQHEVESFGGHWKRRFHFHVPVRVPDLWNSAPVKKLLTETLEFLSDDFYAFSVYPAKNAPQVQRLFDFDKGAGPSGQIEQVMMFSGGLDSLAGAIEEICTHKQRVLLVNHRSTPKFSLKQQELQKLLAQKAGGIIPSHMHVRISKDSALGKEYTQRARSFLFAALGATVAMMVGVKRLRFYENGIVSLNLPVCAQVVGGRATRTTHPKVLDGLQRLISAVAGEPFVVENPFRLTCLRNCIVLSPCLHKLGTRHNLTNICHFFCLFLENGPGPSWETQNQRGGPVDLRGGEFLPRKSRNTRKRTKIRANPSRF